MMGFDHYAQYLNIPWASSILAVALAIGVFAMLLVYISGPSKSLFAMARLGFLPLFFQKTNKKGLPKNILIIQGCLFSILSILFLVMPTVQSFYQIVCQMSIILHLIMYLLLFISILVLRYKCTSVNRPFRIGKRGNLLAWILKIGWFLFSRWLPGFHIYICNYFSVI